MRLVEVKVPEELWPRRGGWKGKVVNVLKKPGEKVARGEVLAEVEIEKAILEIESPVDGVVRKVAEPGSPVEPGSVIALVEEAGA
ncbi:MAG: biotin attachment protein [Desulfurococcales archaeon]|nr:biotin attachment protein [Desulfurococcales archaeon]